MKEISALEKALGRIEKDVNVSFAGPIPSGLLARQDLESTLVVLSDRLTPFRDRVSRDQGQGNAHLWNQRTRLDTISSGPAGLVNLFYADGNIPNQNDPAYVKITRQAIERLLSKLRKFGGHLDRDNTEPSFH
jgi:hypothetical protein